MPKYTYKEPEVFDAWRVNFDEEYPEFIKNSTNVYVRKENNSKRLFISEVFGSDEVTYVSEGDYLLCDNNGFCSVLSPEEFEKQFKEVTE